mgnify:CR=1 FL=1
MRYYCIKQHDITDCGVACLATICKQKLKWVKQIGIDRAESEGCFLSAGQEDGSRKNLKL